MITLTAKSLKASLTLNPDQVAVLRVASGDGKIPIKIDVASRTITAEISGKALRKAQSTIASVGPDGVACVIQGRLAGDNVLLDAGLIAQIKTPKPVDA